MVSVWGISSARFLPTEQKNLLKEFRIDIGSMGVFTIFSVSKQSKNDEVLFDLREVLIVLFPKSFSGYVCFGNTKE